MTDSLLAVKFYIPIPRADLTERISLLKRFEAGLQRPLTLVSAPAGFGKSTLVSMWINSQRSDGALFRGITWLSLEPADNDPLRFWLYFLSALQNCGVQIREEDSSLKGEDLPFQQLIEVIRSDSPPPIQTILEGLINELVRHPGVLLLVLDDYHLLHAALIHEQMAYLLDHLPVNLHLVMLTRADPPLPLARLRVRGQLSEFRAADLRFTKSETEVFLHAALGLDIPLEDRLKLEQSTEGWIAGLQMAALALQAPLAEAGRNEKEIQASIHSFIASFSGQHVYILDYLADEVFNRQPAGVQAFLLKTSVLEKMNVELGDALMQVGSESSAVPEGGSKAILDYIEKTNLFLIPLDHERHWFRYHHLFADLLRARLGENWPGLRPRLLVRASEVFERSGRIEEAIRYALEAEDWERSANLMERHIQSFLELGLLSKIMDWVGRLPKEVATRRAGLVIQQAWVMGLAQHKEAFVSMLDAAEGILGAGGAAEKEQSQETRRLWINLKILRGYQSVMEGNPRHSLELLQEPFRSYPTGGLWEDCWMHWIRGFTQRMTGDLEGAIADFQQALSISKERLWADMVCCTDLGMIFHLQGRLQNARETYLQGMSLAKAHATANHGYLIRLLGGFCEVLFDRNELEEAAQYCVTGLEWMQWWPSANARVRLFAIFGRVRLAQGDLAGGADRIRQAEEERQKWPLVPINDSLVDDALVRLYLAQKDLSSARKWVAAFHEKYGMDLEQIARTAEESMEMRLMALVRICLAEGQTGQLSSLEQALGLCASLEGIALKSGRVRSLIELNVLRAVGLELQARAGGHPLSPSALAQLETALNLAETGRFMRTFIDQGPLVSELLRVIRSRTSPALAGGGRLAYIDALLAAFPKGDRAGQEGEDLPAGVREPRVGAGLVEQLTQREREVLSLMAAGLSNREMAGRLVLSEGTIKTHVHNLMGKLAAQSRTHTLARAKELGLL